ncbi:TPA: hypothetical protein OMD75_005071 [Klebsiella oxytoca]|nr:hypothetical protein [Klebsiella oxytoca]
MSHIRKQSAQFSRIEELVSELEKNGHTKSRLWYSGALTNGGPDKRFPVAVISADSRFIAQKRPDGTWVALYGYDDPVCYEGPEPNAFNLDEYWLQILTWQLLLPHQAGK